jgi:hypothetical protein
MIPTESCCVIDTGGGPSYSCVVGAACPSPAAVGTPASGSNGGTANNTSASGSGGGTGNNTNGTDTTVVALQCGGAANCPQGTVCCAQSGNNNATSSACKPTCSANETQLCDPSAAVSACPAFQPCTTRNASDLGLPPSFGTCGAGGAAN